jgi:hypothetical protein
MFLIKYIKESPKIEIKFNYFVSPSTEREFKMNRDLNETIGKTLEKLVNSLKKQIFSKTKKNDIDITVGIYDCNDQILQKETLNQDAWKEGYKVKINDRVYKVLVDLPFLTKLSLPKLLLTNMPVIAVTEKDDKIIDKSKFSWYISISNLNTNEWELLSEGINNRMIILNENSENKFIKLVCVPSDGTRDGVAIEVFSQNAVQKFFDVNELPMTLRHSFTTERMSGNKYAL